MADQLQPQQRDEYREIFAFFDKKGEGSIPIKEVGVMMKTLGEALKDNELKALCKGGDKLDFNTFLANREEKWAREQSGEEVKEAFRVFDASGSGTISVEDLKFVMTTMGEVMSAQEVDDMIREAGGGPSINYSAFVDKMKRNT